MKKGLLVLLASAFTFGAYAQTPESSSIKYDHWSLNLKGAVDLMRDYGPHVKRSDRINYGGGAELNYMFNPLWGISADYLWSPFDQDPVNFKGHVNEVALKGTIDLSNLLSPYRSTKFLKNFNLYADAGAGISFIHYSNPLTNLDGNQKSGLVLTGLTAEYNLNKYLALNLGAEYRIHSKGDMEKNLSYAPHYDTNDFLVATLGLRIKFGRKDGQHVRNMSYLEYAKQHTVTEDSKLLPMVNSLNDKVNDLQRQVDDLNNRFNAYVVSNNKAMSDLEAKCLAKANSEISNTLKKINFAFGSAKINPDSYAALDNLADEMKDNSDWNLHLAGHTDWIGTKAYNQKLSERRANSVKDYLVSKGIDASRISMEGFGETRPIASNRTKSGRAKNRRVEFDVNK